MTAANIIAALRSGVVPRTGLELFATGLEPLEAAVREELDFVATGEGAVKWLRGDYGAGKTFTARYLCARARARGFATAEVQISVNDTPLYKLETVYRRLMERLELEASGDHALADLVDAWLYEQSQAAAKDLLPGEDPTKALERRLEVELNALTARSPAFAQVLRAYFKARDAGDHATAKGLLAWVAGQPHTAGSVLRRSGLAGKVDGPAALAFLSGLLLLLRQTKYQGLVLVLDEVETLQRLGARNRERSLNVLRQLVDALSAGELPGLYLVVPATTEFFEGFRGVNALPPLAQRVKVTFEADASLDNLRAPQVRLHPFDREKLLTVVHRVRALYQATHPERLAAKVTDAFLEAFVSELAGRFGGKIEVLPRLCLRLLVDVLDKVDQHEGYAPHLRPLTDDDLTDEERVALAEEPGPAPSPPLRPKRLDD